MADKKISALTSATTPLAGTEVLPIVQSSATVKVAVSDLTAGRSVDCSNITASALSKALNFQLDANNGLNYDIKMVKTQGDGGTNTVQTYWNAAFGASAAGGCLGAYNRSGAYALPSAIVGGSDQYTIYGFIGVAP
jgi:hypothetical protein